ncbi:GNAT family N-acetyltransferase [Paractinoplanes atraurantiacus]|uniref:Predicted acetyltransferase n=1 Tax=Paractinoplanes atraurantiacus TaxID=1036182 RepID=A0A285F416_9ACTN|nr:GNAT family N-acetyltransferase [Actinoplanes atraurantiacus]SNY06015.1 Predicted acetyltransferase [Actinoplanes atraurantiacus]
MPVLAPPVYDVQKSFLEAMAEYEAEGRGAPGDFSNIGSDMRVWSATWSSPEVFRTFVDGLRAQALEETPRPASFVPTTVLWWVEGADYLGRLNIRQRLAPGEAGQRNGHIGYDVRPSARRQGHATAMLAAALPLAASLGLPRVLVTCDAGNEASRRTIERNGGVADAPIGEKLRYWITTAR